jgi:hypothetical protein
VLYLCSDAASYMTGTTLILDVGYTARGFDFAETTA